MNDQDNEAPVRIVRKKKASHGGHHGGAWKVAYADFVTAMMALFIVLWIVGQSKQVKVYIAEYFKDPGAFFENTKGGGMFQGSSIAGKELVVEEMIKREQEKLKQMGDSIIGNIKKDPELSALSKQIRVEVVKEGLRIELLEGSDAFFFDVGTATLKPAAVRILSIIAGSIGKLPNLIILEGHTDSRSYHRSDGYGNFELSADRANSARRVLMGHGVRDSQLDEIRGYADTRLHNLADPFDVTNRRISIIIKNSAKATRD
jgi:chemotaxis protein MotB